MNAKPMHSKVKDNINIENSLTKRCLVNYLLMARTRSIDEGCRIRWRKPWKEVDLDVDPSMIN